ARRIDPHHQRLRAGGGCALQGLGQLLSAHKADRALDVEQHYWPLLPLRRRLGRHPAAARPHQEAGADERGDPQPQAHGLQRRAPQQVPSAARVYVQGHSTAYWATPALARANRWLSRADRAKAAIQSFGEALLHRRAAWPALLSPGGYPSSV